MNRKKVLIIGGVATGASTAARLRRLREDMDIVIFEKSDYISFANCGLPYHIGEVIKERDKLLLQTPEKMYDRFRIDVRVKSEVLTIDTNSKNVEVRKEDNSTYIENYDYLVISPGSKPVIPNIRGINKNKIYTLRNIKDMDKIKKEIDSGNVKNAVVVGGGYIGVEVCENLKHRGINVNLVEAAPHILAPFDSEISELLEMEMNDNDVSINLNDKIIEIDERKDIINIKLESGKEIKSDIIISAIGVMPDTEFLKETGIELGERGHILVDKYMRTNIKDVYAGGDAVAVKDFVNGSTTYIPLAGPANRQGRIIADNISGLESVYNGTLGTSIIKVFDITAASTGNNERILKNKGIDYKKVYLYPMSHAGYYPGATGLSIKVLYERESKRVLGAQCVGNEGVDKFIDVLATVIKLKGTMDDLRELELAYAPPYLSAKSPANMAGFIAENESKNLSDLVFVEDLKNRDKENTILLDLREDIEVENGMIEGAIHIPLNSLRDRLNELDKGKEIWVYCAVGVRGWIGERILKNSGFNVKNLSGGYKAFKTFGYKAKSFDFEGEDSVNSEERVDMNLNNNTGKTKEVNLQGLCCPGPLMQIKMYMDELNEGDKLIATASDSGFLKDIEAWAKRTGNTLVDVSKDKGIIKAQLIKGNINNLKNLENTKIYNNDKREVAATEIKSEKNGQTMVVFSGDLDKAIAAFIIANGAAAMGKNVTMFFTFWGLNILRKNEKVKVNKNFIEKMFGKMMPRGSKKLSLSKMNMGGIGAKMIRDIMNKKNVQSLEELIKNAIDNGVKIVACTMSMDVMGIKEQELIDGIEYGGVGYYLGEAEDSNSNLFI